MSQLKIALLGGGGVKWTPRLVTDMFITKELAGSKLVLVDIDKNAAEIMRQYCVKLAEKHGGGWTVETADLDDALDGADAVAVAISTGGLEAMNNDYTIPEKYGVFHTVGDTVGPGGISRTLRNAAVFIDLARRMEKKCPNAWLVHVTNPLAQITRSIYAASSIRTVGLCHNFLGTRALMANYFNCEWEDIQATSVGVNHFSWLKDLTAKGKPVTDQLTVEGYYEYEANKKVKLGQGSLKDNVDMHKSDDKKSMNYFLNFELCEQFGIFPVGAAAHVAENFPWYINSIETQQKHRLGRKGVLPSRQKSEDEARKKVTDCLEGKTPMPELEESIEQLSPVIAALCAGKTTRTVVNMPNIGQVSNLPLNAVVETWATITWDRIEPEFSGEVPAPVTGLTQMIVQEEEHAVKAAISGKRKDFITALQLSPALHDKDAAPDLADELLKANAKWLPQFK